MWCRIEIEGELGVERGVEFGRRQPVVPPVLGVARMKIVVLGVELRLMATIEYVLHRFLGAVYLRLLLCRG